ncbi:MAG: type 4a pilus biogenesis protein PilO [Acidobacteriia bacterium]|nr:type 4a pilus biogenesis protein PilO [Terriglobia bacterium]
MPNPFRDMSVFMQVLVAVAIAVVLVVLGLYLPFSPVQDTRDKVDKAVQEKTRLNQEVQQLQVYRQRYGELRQQMDALSKQLETLKTIVPEEKEVDEFIRLMQGAAGASNVQVRRLTTLPLVAKEYHYEAPFDIQVDGPYFNILDFFSRLSHLSRIINVSDLTFQETESGRNLKYPMRPGTTVTGNFTATTFFTKPAETASSAQAGKAADKPAGRP